MSAPRARRRTLSAAAPSLNPPAARPGGAGPPGADPAGTAPLVPSENVLAAIHVLSNRISRAFYADIEARHGITLPELRVMLTLARHPGMAAMAVADLWGMDKMAISRAVHRLLRAGLVMRAPAAADRRRWVLDLTPDGRRRFRAMEPAATARYREILGALTPGETAQLRGLLDKLVAGTSGGKSG